MSAVAAALVLSVGVSQSGFAADTATPSKGAVQEINIEHYTDSYLFELLDPYGTMGNRQSQYDSKFLKSFKILISPMVARDKRFMGRITSGPESKGEIAVINRDKYVGYHTCQEHVCNEYNLVVLYRIGDGRMIGRLWKKCSVTMLGYPTPQEATVLQNIQKVIKSNNVCD
jgi:hypothetical protein